MEFRLIPIDRKDNYSGKSCGGRAKCYGRTLLPAPTMAGYLRKCLDSARAFQVVSQSRRRDA